MSIQLFHHTSLGAAINIVRSKTFKTASNNPLNGDSGLNAGIVGQDLSDQAFEGWDVTLYFDFDGPLVPMTSLPLATGAVYDALPWRAVVPLGTRKQLRLVKLEEKDGCEWLDFIPPAPLWHPFKESYREKQATKLKNEIFELVAQKPLIKVVGR